MRATGSVNLRMDSVKLESRSRTGRTPCPRTLPSGACPHGRGPVTAHAISHFGSALDSLSSSAEDGSDIAGELHDGSLSTAAAHVQGAPVAGSVGQLGSYGIAQVSNGASYGTLNRNVASTVHLADECVPAHCRRHSPGHRDPCIRSRGTGDVACRDRVHPCRHRCRGCRKARADDPRMAASLIPWVPTHTLPKPFTEVVDHSAANSNLAAATLGCRADGCCVVLTPTAVQ